MAARKIVLVTYSTTGNTKFIQDRIIKQLTESHHSVLAFDALSIIKSYQLGRKKPENLSVEAAPGGLIPDLRRSIAVADVIGIGAFSFGMQTPPGLSEIFSEEYLPADLYKNMKYFFSFGTAGQMIGAVHNIIATLLSNKNKNAVYVGQLTVICPENYAPLQPPLGSRDMWGQKQLDKISPFVDSLIHTFNGDTPIQAIPFKKAHFKIGVMQKQIAYSCGEVLVDKKKCVKCGNCVRNCPYGALTIASDIEDGFPHWNRDRCMYCHLCYNKCPKLAVDYRAAHTKNKARHPSPFLDLDTGAILSTDAATHTVVGIPLPGIPKLFLRNVTDRKSVV